MASNVLPLFWHLASSSRDTRLGASADLVAAAQAFQAAYTPTAKASGDEDEDEDEDDENEADDDGSESGMEVDGDDGDDDVDEETPTGVDPVLAAKLDAELARENAPDVVYCIKRLVRGLGSSRESSRLGFAVALTELLARSTNVTAAQVLSLILRASQWSKGMKGSDERDMMFARLFGVTALVDSGLLFASTATIDDFLTVAASLFALSDAKAWLAEASGWALLREVEGLLASSVEWKEEALSQLTERLYADRAWSPEKIALTLALQRGAPDLDWKKLLAPTFKSTPLLSAGNLVTLGRVLKEGGDDDSSARAGTYQPKLHFVWDGILDEYFAHSAAGIAPFAELFRTVVDEALFANTSSAERKYWGFQVFERALPLLPAESVPLIFTPNFMRSWMNNLSSADRHLHKAAVQVARKVNEHVKADPTAGFTLLSQLVGKHGRPDFDRVTKTKTVEGIMASLSLDGVDKYVAYLENVISSEDEGVDERRTWALDQMLALARNGAVPRGDAWISQVIDTMIVHGFFLVRKADKKSSIAALRSIPKPPISDVVAATARARLFSALVEVTAHKEEGKEGTDSTGKLWLTRALETVAALEKSKATELVSDADDEIKEIRADALATLAALGDEPAAKGSRILVSFLVLQTYDEAEDALDMLDEAITAVKALFPPKKRGRKPKAAPAAEADDDAPPPIDALLDVLVAFLDKGSADLRTLANQVFGMLVPSMTTSAVEHLVAQLESSAATATAEDEDEDEDEDGDEEHEHGPDCNHSDEEDDDEDDDDDSDADSVASDETDANAAVDPEFRKRVAEALKVSGVLDESADKEDDDVSDSDDESVWDDDQMMKVDEQLAAVFKAQAAGNKKADLKHAAIESLHFKNRVLDFFDVFLRRPTPLALHLLLPLLHVVRGGGELGNKAAGILRTRLKSPSVTAASTKDELALAEKVLGEIHMLARKAPSAEFSGLCSAASLFAARLAPDSALPAYQSTLEDFITRKHSSVHSALVGDYVRRQTARAWPLGSKILELCANAANAYRHTAAYGLLTPLLTQAPALVKAGDVSATDAQALIKASIEDVYAVLEGAAKDKEDWKADRLKDAAKFALVAARAAKQLDGADVCDAPRLAQVTEAVKTGRTREMKGVIALLAQLAAVLSAKDKKDKKDKRDSPKAVKRKAAAVEDNEVEEQDEPKTSTTPTKKAKAKASTKTKTKKAKA